MSGPALQDAQPRLRVAIASLYPADPLRIAGGVRAVAYHLVQGLRTWSDLDVHVVHCHGEVGADSDVQDGNVAVHLRTPRARLVPNTLAAVSRVQGLLRNLAPDVVNAHTGHYAVAALRAGLPVVCTVHGVKFREAAIYGGKSVAERLRFYMEVYYDTLAMRRAKHAIAISPYVMREYEGRTRAQWHRIDNPLPDEFFQVPNHEQPGRVLFVGTITEVKDVLTLLRAFAHLGQHEVGADCSLHLAGRTTSPSYEQELRRYVQENGLAERVAFLGMLDRAALLREYAEAAVVVLPSRQENAPMAIIEAMGAGKPVVASRVGGIPDLVESGETGLLTTVGDVAGIAEAVGNLMRDRAARRRMGERARAVAKQRFRADAVARRYREVYFQVAGRPLSSGGQA